MDGIGCGCNQSESPLKNVFKKFIYLFMYLPTEKLLLKLQKIYLDQDIK